MGYEGTGTINELWRYPVSSLAGEHLDSATITLAGVAGDRLGALFESGNEAILSPSHYRRWNSAP